MGQNEQRAKKAALFKIHTIDIKDTLPTSVNVTSDRLSKDMPPIVREIISAGFDWISEDVLAKIAFSAE